MTGKQQFASLKNRLGDAGEMAYGRISDAAALLLNREWVEDPSGGGGDENKAISRLEEECFGDLLGGLSLPQMLDILHNIPSIADWRAAKFHLPRMWADWNAKQNPTSKKEDKKSLKQGARTPQNFPTSLALNELTPAVRRKEYERVLASYQVLQEENTRLKAELLAANKRLADLSRVDRLLNDVRVKLGQAS